MSLAAKLLSASGGGVDKLYVDDVFSAYTRTGTGASKDVVTGIDMTKGYMVWTKGRSGATDHAIYDSERGLTKDLVSNSAQAQTTQAQGLNAVGDGYHSIGSLAKMNTSAATYVDFVFRKAPKFFDVVTYTGDGSTGRQVSHNLGIKPGMYIVKKTSGAYQDWYVWHNSFSNNTSFLMLNALDAVSANNGDYIRDASATTFTLGTGVYTNTSGQTYVAYLFAHDDSEDGIIQCGSYTTDGAGKATVTLGWEPQFLLVKSLSATDVWRLIDSMRGLVATGSATPFLRANTSAAEEAANLFNATATGFKDDGAMQLNGTVIYLAIRRPNKPPTTGTEVYNAIARTGTGAAATVTGVGFAPDLVISKSKNCNLASAGNATPVDRLRGASQLLQIANTNSEKTDSSHISAFGMDGISVGGDSFYISINYTNENYINHFFKRAPGVFDVVCHPSDTSDPVSHGLGVTPELLIAKRRDSASDWYVYDGSKYGNLNSTLAWPMYARTLTTTTFTPMMQAGGGKLITYLFASLHGISKVGSYTGNGTTQTIDCGFTTGARFILIKRTDSAGDWYVWDTVRGLVAGNDPHLSLNSTTAEITTDDSLDPASVGFIVNQLAATNINVTSASYIYLSFA